MRLTRWTIILLALLGLGLSGCVRQSVSEQAIGWDYVPGMLKRIVPPTFPSRDFVVTDFGAAGDGQTDCSKAFYQAVAACNKAGGGRVVVPEGRFLTGPIHLKSNVNLHLRKDATILFSTDPNDYLPVVRTRWEGVEILGYSPLVYAYNQENVAITLASAGALESHLLTWLW
jgi:polygalacturonase